MSTKPQLVKSTSGIRGVIGNGMDAVLAAQYGAAFGTLVKKGTVVIGRDTRPSGDMINRAVIAGLVSVGIDVVDIGVVPTPTVEIAVKGLRAVGGICVTASHNPGQWNALKFFNNHGEFITPAQYKRLDVIFNSGRFAYKSHDQIGSVSGQSKWIDVHISKTLAQSVVKRVAIKNRKFKVVVDAINGAGSEALPRLLKKLGAKVFEINCNGDGNFVHEPEPIPKNLAQLGRAVKKYKADLGMACDPDADRLVLVDEKGVSLHEELTLAIAVQEVLRSRKGSTVINMATSLVTADTARVMGSKVYFSKVGESNVVQMMRQKRALIGGEGNGGVIYPTFHAGRDSLIAAALTLSSLSHNKLTLSALAKTFPVYYNIKSKALLPDDFNKRLKRFEKEAARLLGKTKVNRADGIRFDFSSGWLQIRRSNTEPIYRLIVETNDRSLTDRLHRQVQHFFK